MRCLDGRSNGSIRAQADDITVVVIDIGEMPRTNRLMRVKEFEHQY